jgi:hypothetical protein
MKHKLRRAAGRLLVDRLSLDLYCWWPCTIHRRLAGHPALYRSCHSHEGLFDISGILCTSLHEWNAHLVSKCLSSFIRHNLVSSEVRLVTNKKLVDIVTSITVNFVQPLLYIVEALLISYIIYNLPSKASEYIIGL